MFAKSDKLCLKKQNGRIKVLWHFNKWCWCFRSGEFGVTASCCGSPPPPPLPLPHPTPNPTHTPLAAKGMELEVPLPPSAERRAGDELQRLLKYPSLDNCQLMVWKQLAHCNGNLVPVNHSIPLKARFSLCSGSLCLILRLMVEGATEAAVLTFLPSVAAPCDLRDHTTLFPNNRWLRLFWGGWGWGDATAGGD